jgi:colanic acid/amylovoran biosynthesis glycosyltransferase
MTMRILVATKTFPAVTETFIILHCASLIARGHDVWILAARGHDHNLRSELVEQYHLDRRLLAVCASAGPRAAKVVRGLVGLPRDRRSISLARIVISDYLQGRTMGDGGAALFQAVALGPQAQFDLVHAHFGGTAISIVQLAQAQFLRAPILVTFHGTDLNRKKRIGNRQLYARVFATADHFTVGTRHMAEHLHDCQIPLDRFDVIPMGIDLSRCVPSAKRADERSVIRLITTGRLVEFKGNEFAIRAVHRLRQQAVEVTLDIIGDGPLRQDLESLSRQLDVAAAIKFHGSIPHDRVLELLQQADIYVHPGIVARDGTREGQGLAVAEAQALQLPVVASRVGGIPEVVAEGESVFLVEPGDVPSLAERILVLAQDRPLRRRMGAAGRNFVMQNLDQQVLADRWIALYERILDRHRHQQPI